MNTFFVFGESYLCWFDMESFNEYVSYVMFDLHGQLDRI